MKEGLESTIKELPKVKVDLEWTKNELNEMKLDLESTKTELRLDLESTKTELKSDLESTKTELKLDLDSTKTELKLDLESTKTELKLDLESIKNELTLVKVDLESTKNELKEVKIDLKSTINEFKQVKVDLESTKNELKQVKLDLESTKNELKQVKIDLKSTRNALEQVKVELVPTREQISILRKEMMEKDHTHKKETDQIRASVNDIKKAASATGKPVFFAAVTPHFPLSGIDDVLIFDDVRVNRGGAYDPLTGVFTATIQGLFNFSSTILSNHGSKCTYQLNKNAGLYVLGFSHQGADSSPISVIIELKVGDRVFIKHRITASEVVHGAAHTSFSGYFIKE